MIWGLPSDEQVDSRHHKAQGSSLHLAVISKAVKYLKLARCPYPLELAQRILDQISILDGL
jgi:hypothetical protein